MEGSTSKQKVPLILHSNLYVPSFTDYLGSEFKIRVSDAVPTDTAILTSGVGVLVTQLPTTPTTTTSTTTTTTATQPQPDMHLNSLDQLVERAKMLTRRHRVGVIILIAAMFGEEEVEGAVGALQARLLPFPPLLLPAHGHTQAAAHLTYLAQVTGGERRRMLEERMTSVLQEHSRRNLAVPRLLTLSAAQWQEVVEQFGSLGKVARATSEEISSRTSLSPAAAASFLATLAHDTVTV
ncbi:hypothetical protein Pcinc_041260 [Petrolisthes cinctipes]|uniref:Uncharacterized protein n=1 Tax=Petrolisthes cinctipes TaxID=88211 RepID=A0AAE1BKJ0_PETCI|nr:hypothetical protein Pcinc_041260 [Petrolisthes cinctipes]